MRAQARVSEQFTAMFRRKAFLHWYRGAARDAPLVAAGVDPAPCGLSMPGGPLWEGRCPSQRGTGITRMVKGREDLRGVRKWTSYS
eukprot:gene15061-biopygen7496